MLKYPLTPSQLYRTWINQEEFAAKLYGSSQIPRLLSLYFTFHNLLNQTQALRFYFRPVPTHKYEYGLQLSLEDMQSIQDFFQKELPQRGIPLNFYLLRPGAVQSEGPSYPIYVYMEFRFTMFSSQLSDKDSISTGIPGKWFQGPLELARYVLTKQNLLLERYGYEDLQQVRLKGIHVKRLPSPSRKELEEALGNGAEQVQHES